MAKDKKKKLRYFKGKDAWFVARITKKKAELMSYAQYCAGINEGKYNWFDDHRDDDYNGNLMLIKDTEEEVEIDKGEDLVPPPGMYHLVRDDDFGIGISKSIVDSDKYIDLNDKQVDKITKDIESFFASEKGYRGMGLIHKRGMLLYGPPGTGKTMLIKHVTARFSDKCRILIVPSYTRVSVLESIKEALSDMHTIFIFEELTSDIDNSVNLTCFLNFLDGEDSWDKCLIIATTNYPEKLPGNVVDRPSRFDKLYRFGFPTKAVRRKYLEHMMGKDWVEEVPESINKTDGFSIAYLKELCIVCKLYDADPIEVIKEFKGRKAKIKKEFATERDELGNKRSGIGFSGRTPSWDDDDF